ncbi:hypothetical protein PoB_005098600 [Plakobranchus ocellatus]|uniref:Uncharacterized protein n=1 Tax=Plakobranchus ocellatus TaxID=259542 RepID=A0AAV4BZC7_9GAST|nr:hypothetical protein PoB_005098600 [Plakobranchus ocellatus]
MQQGRPEGTTTALPSDNQDSTPVKQGNESNTVTRVSSVCACPSVLQAARALARDPKLPLAPDWLRDVYASPPAPRDSNVNIAKPSNPAHRKTGNNKFASCSKTTDLTALV